jgi:hypothetical protein
MTMPTLDTAKLTGYLAEIAKLEAIIATIASGGISPQGYVAAALELASLYNEVAGLTNNPAITAEDIAAAHADFQTIRPDVRPVALPPPVPGPVATPDHGNPYATGTKATVAVVTFEVATGDHSWGAFVQPDGTALVAGCASSAGQTPGTLIYP